MIEFLNSLDREVFLLLNGLHSPGMDSLMYALTNALYWTPLFAVVIWFLIKRFGVAFIWILIGIGLTITLADQITSSFMKPFFERLRPSRDPSLEGLVHLVNGYTGGKYGFASSHAANSFGVATFLWLVARSRISWVWVVYVWAAIFSYTRIYLGVHFPGDILVGGLIGFAVGWLIYLIYTKIQKPGDPDPHPVHG